MEGTRLIPPDPEQQAKLQLQAEARDVISLLHRQVPRDSFQAAVLAGLKILIKMVGWSLLR